MITRLFQITGLDPYPTWCENENGSAAPMRELMFKDVTEDPIVNDVICVVYGVDAYKHYELGEYVLATLDIFVGYNEDETRKQVIRARDVNKVLLSQNS